MVLFICRTVNIQHNTIIGSEPIKRILFTGDSITKGALGCNYLDLLADDFPDVQFTNLGQDGDTVSGIMNRTLLHLEQDNEYDLIVIAAGHNDIILPHFNNLTSVHISIVNNLAKRGSIPAIDYKQFIITYSAFITAIKEKTAVPVVVTTLSCLNEDLSAETNTIRSRYNEGIRNLAESENLTLAEVGRRFTEFLNDKECRNYFMDNLLVSVLFDGWNSKTLKRAAKLSSKRSLHLTIDGIHLSPNGAGIYKDVLFEALNKAGI